MVSRARLTGIGAAVLVLVAAGTAVQLSLGDGSDETATSAESTHLSVSLKQYRRDELRRVIQVAVTNRASEPITVERLQLDAPAFAAVPPSRQEAPIAAGDRIDLPIKLGEGRCGDTGEVPAAGQSAGRADVIAWVRSAGGSPAHEVRLSLPQPVELLDRILSLECRQRALGQSVEVGFGDSWRTGEAQGRPALFGSIKVTRRTNSEAGRPAQPVTVVDLAGTVIFGLRPAAREWVPPVHLDAATPGVTIPIELIVERCDGHALAESKKTFVFPVWISLDGAAEVYVTIEPDPAGRRKMEALIRDACHLGG